jgi:hypothetical protein
VSATSIDGLAVRAALGRRLWGPPTRFGPDGWSFVSLGAPGSTIVSCAQIDGTEWLHASMAFQDWMPSYEELKALHAAVFRGYAYEVFAPRSAHVNLHRFARHLWGRSDGRPVLPEFGLVIGGQRSI